MRIIFNLFVLGKGKGILYLQSELESQYKKIRPSKFRLNHLESVQTSECQTIESLNFEVEKFEKEQNYDEARELKRNFEVSTKIKKKRFR